MMAGLADHHGPLEFGFNQDAGTGNLALMSRPNGIGDEYGFDVDGRPTSPNPKDGAGTVIDQTEYTYDIYGYGYLGRRLTATNSLTGTKASVLAGANLGAAFDGTGGLVSWNVSWGIGALLGPSV